MEAMKTSIVTCLHHVNSCDLRFSTGDVSAILALKQCTKVHLTNCWRIYVHDPFLHKTEHPPFRKKFVLLDPEYGTFSHILKYSCEPKPQPRPRSPVLLHHPAIP